MKSARKWQAHGKFSVVQYEVGSGLGCLTRCTIAKTVNFANLDLSYAKGYYNALFTAESSKLNRHANRIL